MNLKYPGRPEYAGPTTGIFFAVHHGVLCEQSHNILERVDYVKLNKPKHEVATRLYNLMYLDPEECPAAVQYVALNADYDAKRAPIDADILAYVTKHIPDHAWRDGELRFE